jgi:peptidoglycan hydrolase CwlO-like protein
MKRAVFVIVLVGLVIATIMAVTYNQNAEQLRQDLAAQSDTTAIVRSQLTVANDSVSSKVEQILVMAGERDSVSQLLAQSIQRADRLAATTRGLKAKEDSLRTLLVARQAQIDELNGTISALHEQIADTSRVLSDIRKELATVQMLSNEKSVLVSQIQPWYLKWKHDATERSFFEKLFGSDKAKAPSFPEPVFPSVPGDSPLPDTAAEPQTSR